MSLMKASLASKLIIGAFKVTVYLGKLMFFSLKSTYVCTAYNVSYSFCSICLLNLSQDGIALAVALLTEVSL